MTIFKGSSNKNIMERFYEIDLMRGIAIILMVFFHFFDDLYIFRGYDIGSEIFWKLPYLIITIFTFLVGVSLTLSYSRSLKSDKPSFKKYLKRGLKIFSWGLVITVVTWIVMGEGFIIFGILHMIGVSVIIAYPLLKYRYVNLTLALGIFAADFMFSGYYPTHPYLLWLGFPPVNIAMFDYIPIIPWFGVVLLGIFFGNTVYPRGKRVFNMRKLKNPAANFLTLLGRNSFKIYLLHQPLIVGAILLLT